MPTRACEHRAGRLRPPARGYTREAGIDHGGSVTHEDVRRALSSVKDPELQRDIVDLGMVRDIVARRPAHRRDHRPHDRGLPAAQPDPRRRRAGPRGDRRRPHRRGQARRHVVRRARRPRRPPAASATSSCRSSSAPARGRAPSPSPAARAASASPRSPPTSPSPSPPRATPSRSSTPTSTAPPSRS